MDIKVLGAGCAKCKKLYAEVEKAIEASGVVADLEKVERIDDMIRYGILVTPALVVNGEVKAAGRIPKSSEIVPWLIGARGEAQASVR